jgi:hypothetical protein
LRRASRETRIAQIARIDPGADRGPAKGWTKFQHPQLGAVEIGGFSPKFYVQNGPPEMLERWARNEAMFNLYMAQSLPKVEIVSASISPLAAAARDTAAPTHEIRVTIRNAGRIPTALEQAKRVKIVRPDQVTARFEKGSSTKIVGKAPEFWLGGGETRTVTLRIRAGDKPDDRKVTVRAVSTRGGVAERDLRW